MQDAARTTPPGTPPSAADLRGLIGYYKIVTYRLAAVLGMSPSRLSAMLNERRPLPPDVATRIARVIEDGEP